MNMIYEQGEICWLWFNRPEAANAYTDRDIEKFVEILKDFETSNTSRALVLASKGKVFHAGGDVKQMVKKEGMFSGSLSQVQSTYRNGVQKILELIYNSNKLTVSCINGAAVGAGFDMTLACDLRIGSSLSRFSSKFVKLGILSGDGGYYFLERIVGESTARYLAITGKDISAKEAYRLGILHELVDEDLFLETQKIVAKALGTSDLVLKNLKEVFRGLKTDSPQNHFNRVGEIQARCHQSEFHLNAVQKMKRKWDEK